MMRSLVAMSGVAVVLLSVPTLTSAQSIKLTPQAEEWQKKNPNKKLVKFTLAGQKEPYVFEGDYKHKGVNLTALQVTAIQRDHVFKDAEEWVAEWNKDPDNPLIRMAGIEYLGPKDGKSWEEKGERGDDSLGISRRRYHKFGGIGRANILAYP